MPLHGEKRIAVKIGSTLLVDDGGTIRQSWLEALAEDIAVLKRKGCEVLIVSSGAIAVGRRSLGLARSALKLEEKQAAAATGQILLAHAYQAALARHGVAVAQILLTPADTEQRRRHLNARATIMQLLKLGVVPVINENDSVATAEIRYGDNDRLAARVATMASADLLVLLSDVDGLYSADPRKDGTAVHVPEIQAITPDIEAMASDAGPGVSTGGMVTKLHAAKIALAGGCRMAIAHGTEEHALQRLADGAKASWFLPSDQPVAARKRWIAGALNPEGEIVVDAGALTALASGKSLLPAGVRSVSGQFERGDAVLIKGPDGRTVGTGLSAYSSGDAAQIAGKRSAEILEILGFEGRTELIHRDDMSIDATEIAVAAK